MSVAVSSDPVSTVRVHLNDSTEIFAVAAGFGTIDGVPTARATLERLRGECERRSRSMRFMHALRRGRTAVGQLLSLIVRVNGELFARSASHDDYVTAGTSLTVVLLAGRRAYVAHAGGTAAYLLRAGFVAALTQDDAIEDGRILSRSIGTQRAVDASVSRFTFEDGDVLALCTRRLRDDESRRKLAVALSGRAPLTPGDSCVAIVRYGLDAVVVPAPVAPRRIVPHAIAFSVAALFWALALLWMR
jgi:protein phosphatase